MTSFENVSWPVTTERLSIRPSRPSDAPAFYAYRRLSEVSEWLPRLSTDEAGVVERFADEDFLRRTLVIEVAGRVVGDLYLAISDAWAQAEVEEGMVDAQAEIGWALSPTHQGRGLAFEAVQRLTTLCFEDLGIHRVYATCFADNTASWHLMEKLGMRREAHHVKDSATATAAGWTGSPTPSSPRNGTAAPREEGRP